MLSQEDGLLRPELGLSARQGAGLKSLGRSAGPAQASPGASHPNSTGRKGARPASVSQETAPRSFSKANPRQATHAGGLVSGWPLDLWLAPGSTRPHTSLSSRVYDRGGHTDRSPTSGF